MKTKKILPYTAFLLLVLSSSFACIDNNEGYSINDFRISIATVIPEGEISYSLLLDNGDKLWPATTDVRYTPQKGQRVFVNYTILSDEMDNYKYYIKVNDIWNILTKPVISLTEANADSIGNDLVIINDIWIGNDYLNIEFSFNYGGDKPHAINLVRNEIKKAKDTNVLELEFRHNSYNSTSTTFYDGFTCFDLKPFKDEQKASLPIRVIVQTLGGTKEYDLLYNYNELNKNRLDANIPAITSNEYI